MNFSKRGWKIAIDAHNEGHASDSCDGAANSSRVTYRDKQSGEYAYAADTQGIGTRSDSLKHPAGRLDLLRGNQCEHSKGADDVDDGDEHASGEHRARQSLAGIANLIAHRGDQLKSGKGEGDLRPEIHG